MSARIIVCGCRNSSDKEKCFDSLEEILSSYKEYEIVYGGAKGADSFGEEYAAAHDVKVTVFKPEWKKYGKAAGPIRNKEMLDYASEDNPVVIAFWDGNSKGTKDMISKARKAGAQVYIGTYDRL